jgi:branched-chain amino acid transport system ATP-binding protein
MLDVREIHTYYGDSYVLQGISLRIDPGQVVGLVGRNGMGKTTLIRSIVGFTPPRRGQVLFKDRDVTGWISNRIVQLGLGLVPQGRRVFPSLSVRENLLVAVKERKGPWTVDRVMELFPRLRERAENRAGKLSGGEQQMLAIARALVTNPDLLLMDEPTEGLAPLLVREVGKVIERLKGEGLSISAGRANLLALRVADHVHVLSRGRIIPPAPRRAGAEPRGEVPLSGGCSGSECHARASGRLGGGAAPLHFQQNRARLDGRVVGRDANGEVWRGRAPPPSQQCLQGG